MKTLNKNASKVFLKLVELSKKSENNHVKLDNAKGAFMALSFEKLHDFNFGEHPSTKFAMAHYFKQNGDLVPDPDMTFILVHSNKKIFSASYQDQFNYREAIFQDDSGKWKVNEKELNDETAFANIWLKNIKEQQNL